MELNSKDLRIGNLVYYQIEDKFDERKVWKEVTEIDAIDLQNIYENYSHIPITEDWLIKAGFEKIYTNPRNCYVYKKNKAYVEIFIYKNGRIDIYITKTVIEAPQFRQRYIKELFIHDLQNKIYSIIGEELNFTL
jgi:hypothetical protein